MAYSLTTVAIVVDADFGDRLTEVVMRMPVWVADTPGNSAAIQQAFRIGEHVSVTSFVVDLKESPESWCAAILGTVDLHHGQYSQDPPYQSIEVIGAPLSSTLRAILEEFGFDSLRPTPLGFVATLASETAGSTRGEEG